MSEMSDAVELTDVRIIRTPEHDRGAVLAFYASATAPDGRSFFVFPCYSPTMVAAPDFDQVVLADLRSTYQHLVRQEMSEKIDPALSADGWVRGLPTDTLLDATYRLPPLDWRRVMTALLAAATLISLGVWLAAAHACR